VHAGGPDRATVARLLAIFPTMHGAWVLGLLTGPPDPASPGPASPDPI
jgi:hypothetical protein